MRTKIVISFCLSLFILSCATPQMQLKHMEIADGKKYNNSENIKINKFDDKRSDDEKDTLTVPQFKFFSPVLLSGTTEPDMAEYLQIAISKEFNSSFLFTTDDNRKAEYVLDGQIESMKVTRMWSWGLCLTPLFLGLPLLDFPEYKAFLLYQVNLKKGDKVIFQKLVKTEYSENVWIFRDPFADDIKERGSLILDKAVSKSINILMNDINETINVE